jgi:hypothetical protein
MDPSPLNTDTDTIICVKGKMNPDCTGSSTITDFLEETRSGLTLSVTQTFYINRQQVPVFWPKSGSTGFSWYGSPKQKDLGYQPAQPSQRATTKSGSRGGIRQLDIDPTVQASCQSDPNDSGFAGGCSVVGP